jgi:hypothetical protein
VGNVASRRTILGKFGSISDRVAEGSIRVRFRHFFGVFGRFFGPSHDRTIQECTGQRRHGANKPGIRSTEKPAAP